MKFGRIAGTAAIAAAIALGSATTATGQAWTKSKWGPKDEIGAANLITPSNIEELAEDLVRGSAR